MLENNINNYNDLLFHEYRPVNLIVWKNKNKINWILTQDFYLNWWMKNYTITEEFDWEKWEIIIDNNTDNLSNYAILSFFITSENNFFIRNLENNTKTIWLWVFLINKLKKKLKDEQTIELIDTAKNKKWKRNNSYYKKQWFEEGFFISKYTKSKKHSKYSFLKLFHFLLKYIKS